MQHKKKRRRIALVYSCPKCGVIMAYTHVYMNGDETKDHDGYWFCVNCGFTDFKRIKQEFVDDDS